MTKDKVQADKEQLLTVSDCIVARSTDEENRNTQMPIYDKFSGGITEEKQNSEF